MLDYFTLKIIWWALVGVLLIGFAIMDGHDMGVGTLLPFVGRNDMERRVVINTVGAALGWQSGLVHYGRWRVVRRMAGGLCHCIQRILLGDDPGALGVVLPPGGFRLPQQDPPSDVAQYLGLGAFRGWGRAAAGVRHRIWQPVAGRTVPLQ
nr:hypothetical protein GCM10020185_81690 [Pseudomonas brassicacearum subsp. brassicacearum]